MRDDCGGNGTTSRLLAALRNASVAVGVQDIAKNGWEDADRDGVRGRCSDLVIHQHILPDIVRRVAAYARPHGISVLQHSFILPALTKGIIKYLSSDVFHSTTDERERSRLRRSDLDADLTVAQTLQLLATFPIPPLAGTARRNNGIAPSTVLQLSGLASLLGSALRRKSPKVRRVRPCGNKM
jgi:hypothetical protein